MAFRLTGNGPGENLYNLSQDVRELNLTVQERLKAMIEDTLGHSIESLKNQPELLRELLSDRDKDKRASAVLFLDKFDQNLPDYEQIYERLALQDAAAGVRSVAIDALGELGTYRHRNEIVRLLHGILTDVDEPASVRESAILAMSRIYVAVTGNLKTETLLALIHDVLDPPGNEAAFTEERINADWIRELTETHWS